MSFFCSILWITDFIIDITQLYYLLHYLTSCSIDWCGGFSANLVFIIQITLVFILKFHLNLKGVNVQSLSISYCSKSVAAESKCQFYLYYHKFTDFCSLNNWNLWFTGLLHLLQHRQMWWSHNVLRLFQLFMLHNYLTLVPQTSEQAKLSISCSQNAFAENSYYFYFIESWIDLIVWL